jgi:hypothetical protein
MTTKRRLRILKLCAIGVPAVAFLGLLVMALWNSLMPALFGMRSIGFWQALGLFLLSKLLFGGFAGGGRSGNWRHRMMQRWQQMTPEERERFLQEVRGAGPSAAVEGHP